MKQFFTSRVFKFLVSAVAVLVAITVALGFIGYKISPQSNLIGMVITPVQVVITKASSSVERFLLAVARTEQLEEENNRLREQLSSARSDLIDLDKYKSQNEFYGQFLQIKEEHPDFLFSPATVVSADAAATYDSFVIDSGSSAGIALHDPVITAEGLVGYISEVGDTFSTVTTILSPSLSVGSMDSRTRETGVLSGDSVLLKDKMCRLSYLSRSSTVAIGDYIITSGSGNVFPQGLIIGTIDHIDKDDSSITISASIKPIIDFSEISQVMVITQFSGQGGLK